MLQGQKIKMHRSNTLRKSNCDYEKLDEENCVLSVVYEAYLKKERVGRRLIYEKLRANGLMISENRIRSIINLLEYKELVEVKTGRAGTLITKSGIDYMNKWD